MNLHLNVFRYLNRLTSAYIRAQGTINLAKNETNDQKTIRFIFKPIHPKGVRFNGNVVPYWFYGLRELQIESH